MGRRWLLVALFLAVLLLGAANATRDDDDDDDIDEEDDTISGTVSDEAKNGPAPALESAEGGNNGGDEYDDDDDDVPEKPAAAPETLKVHTPSEDDGTDDSTPAMGDQAPAVEDQGDLDDEADPAPAASTEADTISTPVADEEEGNTEEAPKLEETKDQVGDQVDAETGADTYNDLGDLEDENNESKPELTGVNDPPPEQGKGDDTTDHNEESVMNAAGDEPPVEKPTTLFDTLDTNGDGVISKDEFSHAEQARIEEQADIMNRSPVKENVIIPPISSVRVAPGTINGSVPTDAVHITPDQTPDPTETEFHPHPHPHAHTVLHKKKTTQISDHKVNRPHKAVSKHDKGSNHAKMGTAGKHIKHQKLVPNHSRKLGKHSLHPGAVESPPTPTHGSRVASRAASKHQEQPSHKKMHRHGEDDASDMIKQISKLEPPKEDEAGINKLEEQIKEEELEASHLEEEEERNDT